MRSETVELEIPFHDVDSLQIVWHGHYAKYFEIARCKLLDSISYNYRDMEKSGYSWPIVEMKSKFIRPLSFGQKIRVTASIVEWENRLKIKYLIQDADSGQKLSQGYTTQMAVVIATGETCYESPAILRSLIDNTASNTARNTVSTTENDND
ncbi:MAG: hypothetical protein COA42_23375 [Alteromonadaceae bacterium]|nr:MAG: hypothetical protein COA42_23375 [Alteromonadaceae bacterium]